MRAGRTLRLRLVTLAFGASCRLVGVALDLDTGFFAAVVVAETVLLAAAGWVVAAPMGLRLPALEFDRAAAVAMARRSMPLLFGSLAAVVYMQLDMVFVFQLAGPAAGGIYAVASKLALLAYTIPVIVFNALMPLALREFHDDTDGAAQRIAMLLSGAFWMSVAVAIVIAAAADILVSLMFTPDFAAAAGLLRIFMIAVPFSALGSGTLAWFVMRRAETAALMRTLAGLVVSAVGCLLLVPRFGAAGAAVAAVLTFAVAGFLATPMLGPVGREAFRIQLSAVFLRPLRRGTIPAPPY
jgi:O-antigen/teichoic acid export membrane protein